MSESEGYQSPFSWRYGSKEMRMVWSEANKRLLWRKIWVELARVQSGFGLVSAEQVRDLEEHQADINIPRALEIEAQLHHDLMAEVRTFAEQCPVGGGVIHLGATSMDIEDNADALRLRDALVLIHGKCRTLLRALRLRILESASMEVMAFTHLQPAEPTTLGYRLALIAQDLIACRDKLNAVIDELRGKGFKGAVGTGASYIELLGESRYHEMEEKLSRSLGISFYPVASQTSPRLQEYWILSALAGLGAVLNKFAFDLRLMQSPVIGEWTEPFGKKQVGSSAMPFKRNPINAEKMDSLARQLSVHPITAWSNAAHSLLERTLDDSANRRSLLPEACLIADELLRTALKLVEGMVFNPTAMQRNFQQYAPFAATERVLMKSVQAGADRQEMHEILRGLALRAWQQVQAGEPNSLADLVAADPRINVWLSADEIRRLMSADGYTGIAEERALRIASQISDPD